MVVLFVRHVFDEPGPMFPTVLAAALAATVGVVLLHLAAVRTARHGGGPRQPRTGWHPWERLIYAVTVSSIAVLAVTAFYSVLVHGAMQGWMLLAHMLGAGLLVAALPLFGLTWALRGRLPWRRGEGARPEVPTGRGWLTELLLWVILITGAATAGSMLAGMFPQFDTERLRQLVDVHRYSGLVLAVAATIQLYSVLLGRFGLD